MKIITLFIILIFSQITNAEDYYCDDFHSADCEQTNDFLNNQNIDLLNDETTHSGFLYELKNPNNGTFIGAGLLISPIAFIASTTIHEGMHALAALARGHKVKELHVIPFKKDGRLFYGLTRIKYSGLTDEQIHEEQLYILSAPMVLNATLLSIYTGHAIADKLPRNKWAKFGLLVLATTQVVDLLHHAIRADEGTDSAKVLAALELKGVKYKSAYAGLKTFQYGFVAVGLVGIGLEGYRLLISKDYYRKLKTKDDKEVSLYPYMDEDQTGLVLQGTF